MSTRPARRPAAHAKPVDAPVLAGVTPAAPAHAAETPTERLDRIVHTSVEPLTGGLSPVSMALAWADWAWHLGASPGRQMELGAHAAQAASRTLAQAVLPADGVDSADGSADDRVARVDDDPRFRHPAWAQWPFSVWRAGFREAEAFWRQAAVVPGMTAHHAQMTRFFAQQWLGMLAPANWLATNPVVLKDAMDSRGEHLVQGAMNWWRDMARLPDPQAEAEAAHFRVGQDLATTPGAVVYRNRLIELIRYAPQTTLVHPEPLLIVPSWIMKFYILDLSPHNSLVRYLVGQGHTVYMVSWLNPDVDDRDLTMDDYLQLGVREALRAVADLHARGTSVHTMGYCLGGTLLAIAAAALAHQGPQADAGLPPLASLTLLAAQTDFSEPGELGLFIDESQVGYLDEITRNQGYLTGKQMAGSFQFLHSRELVWTRRMREYLMGEREQKSDLMAWNADTTRMPARMHHEYLTSLYLHNALATSSYRVDGRAVSLADIRLPVFLVGTERDHISPWRSVYKLHHLTDTDIHFVLTSGGHNAGIVSEPGHPGRSYRMAHRESQGGWIESGEWLTRAQRHEGSWWPAWQAWLAARSGKPVPATPIPQRSRLGLAPGTYVMTRYSE